MFSKQQKMLEKLKSELENRLKDLKTSLTDSRSKDWEEAAVESENDEVLQGIYAESAQELLQVDYTLQRIAQGEYGDCEKCGAEINKKRLKIMPFTTLCIKCAQQLEYKHR